MSLTRRSFLAACVATTSSPGLAGPLAGRLETLSTGLTDPVAAWRRHLAGESSRWANVASPSGPESSELGEFPWTELRRLLRSRFSDLRRHFVFEYYPWYADAPYRHWQQWGREPPADLAANTMPLLGAYDSRSTAVLEQHARWIAESGVGVVNLSWWGPGSFSDRAVSRVMDVMGAHDIQVSFHLEPYGPTRVARLSSDVRFLLREYGEKRRWDCFFLHQRANGTRGPVFKLFSTTLPQWLEDCHGVLQEVPGFTPDGVWRQATDEVYTMLDGVFPHVTLLSNTWDAGRVKAAGLDGIAIYGPGVEPEEWLDHALTASRLGTVFSFNVNPGQDEIRRRKIQPDSCYTPRPFLPRTRDLDWATSADREFARQLAEQRILESLQATLLLQTHPWLGNVDRGFFLVHVCSFNEWHEGHQFEPMMDDLMLSADQRASGYHNPREGSYRLRYLTELIGRLL